MKSIKFVGLDVHAETIAVAVAGAGRGSEIARSHSESGGVRFGSWSRNWDQWSSCVSAMKRAQRGMSCTGS